jgi:lysozyme
MVGIDVSHWQGNINWATCRQNISFALLKCTQGNGFYDHTYVYNKLGVETNKIPHGAYHYFLPGVDGSLQADWFHQKANDAALKVWVIDVELAGAGLEANLEKMIDRLIELTTCIPWIYTSAGFWNGNVNHALTHPCPLWVANYTTAPSPLLPHGWTKWKIWQYSKTGIIPGIIGYVDMNRFNGDVLETFGNGEIIIPPAEGFSMEVLTQGLMIRKTPSIIGEEVGSLNAGEVLIVDDIGGDSSWIKHSRGWSCVQLNTTVHMKKI